MKTGRHLQSTSNQGWQPFPIPGIPPRDAGMCCSPAHGSSSTSALQAGPPQAGSTSGRDHKLQKKIGSALSLFFLLNLGSFSALVVKCHMVALVCNRVFNFTIQQSLLKNSPVIHIALKKKKPINLLTAKEKNLGFFSWSVITLGLLCWSGSYTAYVKGKSWCYTDFYQQRICPHLFWLKNCCYVTL